jgi:FixJ family two-component response regulator
MNIQVNDESPTSDPAIAPTVFVVDDDPAALESISAAMNARGRRAELYASAEAYLEQFDPRRPGCLVLDLRLGGMDGVALQQELIRRDATMPIVVITAYPDVPSAVSTIGEGAVAYLTKPYREGELQQCVDKALEQDRRQRAVQSRRGELARRFATLTDSEREVLDRLMRGQPNKEIAAELSLGLRTVELRRAKIFEKVEARSLAELIRLKTELDHLGSDAT